MTAARPAAAILSARQAARRASLRAARFSGVKILLPFALLVAIWWAIKASGNYPENVLVSPLTAWRTFVYLVTHGVMAEYASTSLGMIGVAASLSMLIGVPIGFAVGVNRYAAHSLEGFLRFLQGISGIAWLPLAIMWFGFTHTTTLVVVMYTLVVPIMFNTMIGVRAIPENYVLALRSLGAGRLRLVTDVYLPGALPSHRRRPAARHGLRLARADRSGNAGAQGRPRRSRSSARAPSGRSTASSPA